MTERAARYIQIRGLVQGVGFRPFIYRLAVSHDMKGWVVNGNDGVRIHAEGNEIQLDSFIKDIRDKAPEASSIHEITVEPAGTVYFSDFRIQESMDISEEITEISPDIAVCTDCLQDMKSQPHRKDYPFINCTNCGPRFTIIRDLPYDRPRTTMAKFTMCRICRKEYADVMDRRFHAQPVACNECGPHYELLAGEKRYKGTILLSQMVCELIMKGKVMAVKGMGGYHLACDALNETAVKELRLRKNREGKPFAVMFRNLETARQFAEIDQSEEQALLSWRRPIVILRNKADGKSLAPSVSNGFSTTGIMMPFMPFHYLMFEKLRIPAIVLTSGNLSDEPIVIDNGAAESTLPAVADAFLSYNRDIFNRTDDSVTMVVEGETRLIRRSRGYVPSPHRLGMNTEGIFAAGAELVNCFCIGKGNQAIMSQHIGDLKNLETLDFYAESFDRFRKMFRVSISLIACDLHPDYLSTRFSEEFSASHGDLPVMRIQHHHAHIASCMAENNLDEPVIGISLDGVGYGTDRNVWGFEILEAGLSDFTRLSHLEYIEQPGGDLATYEPWRMALSYLLKYTGAETDVRMFESFRDIPIDKIRMVQKAIRCGINSPLGSSAGRLFDAVAALTGVCTFSSFHAEAPMRLENILDPNISGSYEMETGDVINPMPMIRSIVQEIRKGLSPSVISTRFHRAVVNAIVDSAVYAREMRGLTKVVLSGGVFQNRFILSNSILSLNKKGFQVYSQKHFPSNDGGIALGQLAIAAKKRAMDS